MRIRGGIYHLIGPLLPYEGRAPGFAQLYICDNELEARHAVFRGLDPVILASLQHTLHSSNPYIKEFKAFARREDAADLELRLLQNGDPYYPPA